MKQEDVGTITEGKSTQMTDLGTIVYKFQPLKKIKTLKKQPLIFVCKYVSKFVLNKLHASDYGMYCSKLKRWHLI